MDNKPVILALAVDSGLLVEYLFIKWSLKIDRTVCRKMLQNGLIFELRITVLVAHGSFGEVYMCLY